MSSNILISTRALDERPLGAALWVVEKSDVGSDRYRYFTDLSSALDQHRKWLECSLTGIYGVTHVSLYLALIASSEDSNILLKPLIMKPPQGDRDPFVQDEYELVRSGEVVGWGESGDRFLEYKSVPEGHLALVTSTNATEVAHFRERGSKVLDLRLQTSGYPRARLDVAVSSPKTALDVDVAVGVPPTNRSVGNLLKSCSPCISTYFLSDAGAMEVAIRKIKTLGEIKVVDDVYESGVETPRPGPRR